jgi:hypothetical protein
VTLLLITPGALLQAYAMGDDDNCLTKNGTTLALSLDRYEASIPQCCCGQADCAFLAHTCGVLEDVQRDARTAGELGQVRWLQ